MICDGGALFCQNQARCINNKTCLCNPGYTGEDCSIGQFTVTLCIIIYFVVLLILCAQTHRLFTGHVLSLCQMTRKAPIIFLDSTDMIKPRICTVNLWEWQSLKIITNSEIHMD